MMKQKEIIQSIWFQFLVGGIAWAILMGFGLLDAQPVWVRFLGCPAVGIIGLYFFLKEKENKAENSSGIEITELLIASFFAYPMICFFIGLLFSFFFIYPVLKLLNLI